MSIELATAHVSIIPSTRGIAGQLRSELNGPLEAAGKEGGDRFAGGLTAIGGKAAKVGGVAIAAGFAAALTKGFGRLRAIDDARFKLSGLGHDAQMVDAIMSDANESVLGTAFGLEEAATIAAGAVAAGVEPGQDLQRTLKLTGDAASIAGISLGEMGSIFGKVAAGNRMMTQEMNQLTERGVPVLQYLQEEFGVTAQEAREMVERGEVDFATFQKIIEDNIGGAALKAGESFSGSLANMGAAVGRFGAAILGPAFAAAPVVFGKITAALTAVTRSITPLVERFSGPLAAGMGVVAGVITAVLVPAMIAWGVQTTIAAAKTAAAWTIAQLASIKGAAVQAVAVARTVGGWVLMGVQSLLGAAKMAAAWFIALGPIGWVTAAVIAIVALIIANWDKVSAWTKKAWTAVTDTVGKAWNWIKTTTSNAVAAVVGFFGNLRDRAVAMVGALRDRVVSTWQSLVSTVVGAVSGFVSRIVGFFTSLRSSVTSAVEGAKTAAVTAFAALASAVTSRVASVVSTVRGLPGRIKSALGNLGSLLVSAGSDMIRGLIRGITNMAGRAADAAKSAVKGAVDGAKRFLRISSPSKVWADIGVDSGRGLVVGLESMLRRVSSAGADVAGAALHEVGSAVGGRAVPVRAAAVSAQPDGVGSLNGARLRLVVNGAEFDAYLEQKNESHANARSRGSARGLSMIGTS